MELSSYDYAITFTLLSAISVVTDVYYTMIKLQRERLLQLTTLSLNQSLSLVVQVQLVDDNLGWVNVDWDRSTRGLFLLQLLDLNGKLQSVDSGNLTLGTLLGTSDNGNLIFLSDWKRSDVVLFSQLLGEGSGQQNSSLGRASSEVSLSGLRTGRRNVCIVSKSCLCDKSIIVSFQICAVETLI